MDSQTGRLMSCGCADVLDSGAYGTNGVVNDQGRGVQGADARRRQLRGRSCGGQGVTADTNRGKGISAKSARSGFMTADRSAQMVAGG